MKSIVIMRVEIKDSDKLKDYQSIAPKIISDYEGKILARGGDVITFEGPEEYRRIILIEFPNIDKANAFYQSQEYQDAIKLRLSAADFEIIGVECLV